MDRLPGTVARALVSVVATAWFVLALQLVALPARADDWSIRRSPFDPRIVGRYKALLRRRPNDGYALRKLLDLYRKHRSVGALIKEYRGLARRNPGVYAYQLVLGHLYRRTKQLDKAVERYQSAAKLNAKSPTVPAALGALHKKQGKVDQAKQAFTRALELSRSRRQKKRYLRALANLCLVSRDVDGARKYFDRLVALEPRNVFLRLELAQALARAGLHKQAIAQYEKILGRTSDTSTRADALKEIGALQTKMGLDEQAIATYRKAMKLTARGHWLRKELTDRIIAIHRKKEQLKQLITHYEKTWRRRGHFEHDVLARLYDETGDEEKAIKSYRAALRARRHAIDTRARLIKLLQRTGRTKEVLAEYRALARIAPGEPKFQLELARLLRQNGSLKESLAVLDRCAKRFPRDASVQSAVADAYHAWGEYGRSLAAAKLLVRIEPRDPAHWINLGEQYMNLKQKRKAIETWRRLLTVIPKRDAAYAKLAELYAQHEMFREAIELYRKAIRLKDKHLPYRQSLARLLEQQRQHTKALAAWRQVAAVAADKKLLSARAEAWDHIINIWSRTYQLRSKTRTLRMDFAGADPDLTKGFLLAKAYAKLGKLEQAAGTYRRIIELDGDNLLATSALEQLYRRQRKLAEAVKLLKRMAELNPNMRREYYYRISDLELELFHDDEALLWAQKATSLGRKNARSFRRLGELFEKKHDYASAMVEYARAIKAAPSHFGAYFALARLHTRQGDYREAEKLYRKVIIKARTPENVRRAFRRVVDLTAYLGGLKSLEKQLLPLTVANTNAKVYRELLVKIYRRRIPLLIHHARQGDADTRRDALEQLRRIGIRGLAPLLEELATGGGRKVELIRILGYLGNPNAVLPLLRIARASPDDEVTVIHASRSRYRYYRRGYSRHSGYVRAAARTRRRVAATVAMGRIGHRRALPGLVELLQDNEGGVREAAAWALGRIPGKRSARALFNALGDSRSSVQMMACAGLGVVGGAGMRPVLEEVMQDPARARHVRAACAWGLGALGDPRAVGSLTSVLVSSDGEVQRCAAWSLGAIGEDDAIPSMLRSLWTRRRVDQQALLWSVVRLARGDPHRPTRTPDVLARSGNLDAGAFISGLTRTVGDLEGRALARGLLAVVQAHDRAISTGLERGLERHRDTVLRALRDLDHDPHRLSLGAFTRGRRLLDAKERGLLDSAVKRAASRVTDNVERLTRHRDTAIRGRAYSVLAKLGAPRLDKRLAAGLSDSLWRVRVQVMHAIVLARRQGTIDLRTASALLRRRLRAEHWREREEAVRSLGRIQARAATRALERAVGDRNGFVRQAALWSLGEVGARSAHAALARGYRDDVAQVRAAACRTASRVGLARDPRHRPTLERLLRDPEPLVRRAARAALR